MLDNFCTGIKNLIVWLPVIWNDRQWDYAYFLKLMDKKLDLMETAFRAYSKKDSNVIPELFEIKKAKELLNQVQKERDWTRRNKLWKRYCDHINSHMLNWWD